MNIIRRLNSSRTTTIVASVMFGLAAFFLFYHLGHQSLHPWDEAWYAAIARNVTRGDVLEMRFNGEPYQDHPPAGHYSIALSYLLFGITEFTTRLPMALYGLLAGVFIYKSGKRLAGPWIGLAAATILFTSRWFLLRARTGNLDSLLVFSQILVFYFSYDLKTRRRLFLLWLSFGFSLITKSAISLTLGPLVLLATFNYIRQQEADLKTNLKNLGFALIVFLIPLLPWYGYNTRVHGFDFLKRNIYDIGLRGGTTEGVSIDTTKQTLLYLHAAVHKWYRLFQISIVIGIFYLRCRAFRWTLLYLFLAGFPYFISSRTQIWHLLPIVPPMALIIPLAYTALGKSLIDLFKSPLAHATTLKKIFPITVFLGTAAVAVLSLSSYWSQFINQPRAVSDQAKLAKEAYNWPGPIVLQSTAFFPTVVFYSDHKVEVIDYIPSLIENPPDPPYTMLIKDEALLENKHAELIARSNSLSLWVVR